MCLVVVVDPVGCQLGGCGLCGVGSGLQLLVSGGCLGGVGVLSWWWIVVKKWRRNCGCGLLERGESATDPPLSAVFCLLGKWWGLEV